MDMDENSTTSDPSPSNRWALGDAKARFSELIRRANTEGPQHVTVHGRESVVVLTADAFNALQPRLTGQALIDACQACPFPELDIAPPR